MDSEILLHKYNTMFSIRKIFRIAFIFSSYTRRIDFEHCSLSKKGINFIKVLNSLIIIITFLCILLDILVNKYLL